MEWTREYPAHLKAQQSLCASTFPLPFQQLPGLIHPPDKSCTPLAVHLNQSQVLPISAYKKTIFACTKAILCNIQYTTV